MASERAHLYEVEATPDLIDAGGVLYHANHLVLAERAREAALGELGSPLHQQMWSDGRALLVRDVSAQYRKPVFAGAKLLIASTVTASGDRLEFVQRFFCRDEAGAADRQSDRPVCELRALLVCVNVFERRVSALPGALLEALGAGTAPASQGAVS
jgi:YbgC/YbaW family acyl-CoA thioester hydrolase